MVRYGMVPPKFGAVRCPSGLAPLIVTANRAWEQTAVSSPSSETSDVFSPREGPSHWDGPLCLKLLMGDYRLLLQRRVAYPASPARPLPSRAMVPGSGTNSSSSVALMRMS
jgi:hypothetical protein